MTTLERFRNWLVLAQVLALLAGAALASAADGPGCIMPPWHEGGTLRSRAPAAGFVPGPPALAPAPTVGRVRLLVILAEFADLPHRADPQRFDDRVFGPGVSLRQYYLEVSQGLLDVDGEVYGWVTLPRTGFDYSDGVGGIGSYPYNGQGMAEDAVVAAVAQGLDLDLYDGDGNGIVDALLVIHSGQGFEWAGEINGPSPQPEPEAIHSHKWSLMQHDFGSATRVVDYFTCPELQLAKALVAPGWTDSVSTIGVYCHEFGHVLGLPDLYDSQTPANYVGVWDIMDFGTWNRIRTDPSRSAPGVLPSHFSAWSKLLARWSVAAPVAPAVGEEMHQTVILESATTGGFAVQLLANAFGVDWTVGSPGTGEYFLGEVRTRTGFDAGLPSEGLLLYHVDESRANNTASANPDGGVLLRLLAQDDSTMVTLTGPPDTTDHWPGAQTTFGPSSDPSSRFYGGSASGVTLSAIGVLSGNTVTLNAEVVNLSTANSLPFARPNPFQPSVHASTGLVLSLEGLQGAPAVGVYDVRGRQVRTLAASDFESGHRVAYWNGLDDSGAALPAGVYYFRRLGEGGGASGRIVLLR